MSFDIILELLTETEEPDIVRTSSILLCVVSPKTLPVYVVTTISSYPCKPTIPLFTDVITSLQFCE